MPTRRPADRCDDHHPEHRPGDRARPSAPRHARTLLTVLSLLAAVVAGLLAGLPAGAPATAGPRPASAPALSVSPASGPSGTVTTVSGSSFRPRSKGSVRLGAVTHAVTTDAAGALRLIAPVPQGSAPGPLVVSASVGASTARTSFLVTAPPAPTPQPRLRFGVSTPGGPTATAELDAVTELAGEAPTVVLSYADFTRELDVAGLQAVSARGAVPLLTWEPWRAGAGTSQPAYALDRIAAGDFDPYLRRWAQGLREFGGPVLLRFAHEMNGDWYPWSEGVNGNGPGDHAAAWRHVHAVVTSVGTPAVSWVWSPNVPYPGSVPLSGLFPGTDTVDVVALDGYNAGTSQPWSTWVEPASLLGPGLDQLRALAPGRPVIVAETAATELGGSKPEWIRSLVRYLSEQPDVTAVVWFDHLKETDWRMASSPASATAVREALLLRRTTT